MKEQDQSRPQKIPEPLRGLLRGFPLEFLEERTPKGQFFSERLPEGFRCCTFAALQNYFATSIVWREQHSTVSCHSYAELFEKRWISFKEPFQLASDLSHPLWTCACHWTKSLGQCLWISRVWGSEAPRQREPPEPTKPQDTRHQGQILAVWILVAAKLPILIWIFAVDLRRIFPPAFQGRRLNKN